MDEDVDLRVAEDPEQVLEEERIASALHARRTGQTSRYGDFLDHGLDQLTAVYVGVLSAGALGLDSIGMCVLWVAAPAAATR